MAKEDVLAQFAADQVAAVSAVYDAGFINGVASVPASEVDMGLSAVDEAMAIAVAVSASEAALQVETAKLNKIRELLA